MYRLCVLSTLVVFALPVTTAAQLGKSESSRGRAELNREVAAAEAALRDKPGDSDLQLKVTRLLFESGDFWRAREQVARLLKGDQPSVEAISYGAKLAYLLGDYDKAERLYKRLIQAHSGNMQKQIMAKVGLLFVYYQTNRYDMAKKIEFPPGVLLPNWDTMKSFDEPPYRMQWASSHKSTTIPFVMTDPLPMLSIEYDGHPVYVVFDTGADMCIVDTELAKTLGITEVASGTGVGGGGLPTPFAMGKLNSMKVGEVTLHNVPITILPTKRFSKEFADGKYPVSGIVGTGLIHQFLTTIDYANGRMILRERSEANSRKLSKTIADAVVGEVPFALHATHFMTARGSLNGRGGLTFLVDSGLADDDAMVGLPIETLRYLGIPEPERKVDPDSAGGGGGVWASAEVPLESVGLGNLTQEGAVAEYGGIPPATYWSHGFIQDGLISHRFLRRYESWTIDFDRMIYIFTKAK